MNYHDDEDEDYGGSRALRNHAPVHEVPDDLWVPELVQRRLIDAVRIIIATGGAVGPAGLDRGSGSGGKNYPPRKVTLAEQASTWPQQYIPKEQTGALRVLMLFLWCKGHRRQFKAAIKGVGWASRTAYRRRDQALRWIAEGLNRDQVKVEV